LCGIYGIAEEAADKRSLRKKQRPQGLKSALISRGLCGPEGPLFHGNTRICEFSAAAEAKVDCGAFTASQKRCPDTNREFFTKLDCRVKTISLWAQTTISLWPQDSDSPLRGLGRTLSLP
jgi:hypothetical protein